MSESLIVVSNPPCNFAGLKQQLTCCKPSQGQGSNTLLDLKEEGLVYNKY
jgi:hypothetical protein